MNGAHKNNNHIRNDTYKNKNRQNGLTIFSANFPILV